MATPQFLIKYLIQLMQQKQTIVDNLNYKDKVLYQQFT